MPTSSQWQILKTLLSSKTSLQGNGVNESQTLNDNYREYKPLLLDTNIQELERAKRNSTKSIENKLHCLGFRKFDNNLKKLPTEKMERVQQDKYTDGIIKELLHSNNARCTSKKRVKDPCLKPTAVCFNYPGSDLTHHEVKKAMDNLLQAHPGIMISTIEFQPGIKLLLRNKMDNTCRWVISFLTEWERCRMSNRELIIRNETVLTKCYDEIVIMEHKQYKRLVEIKKIAMNA